MKKTDQELVNPTCLDACCRADAAAWREFVEAAAPVILTVVRRLVRPDAPFEVDDAVQEVFVRLCAKDFRLLKNFNAERSSLATFLRVVASSTTIDLLRRQRLPVERHPEDAPASESARDVDLSELPMDDLTERQTLILRLLFGAQMEVRDVARVLGVEEQTVRSSKHKALERLRAGLKAVETAKTRRRNAPRSGDALASDPV